MMLAAVIALGVVVLAQLGLFAWVYQQQAVERASLLDRIQAPDAPRLAAFSEFAAPDEGREVLPADPLPVDLPWDEDLQFISTEDEA